MNTDNLLKNHRRPAGAERSGVYRKNNPEGKKAILPKLIKIVNFYVFLGLYTSFSLVGGRFTPDSL
jgi:hypothetical protein